MAFVLAHFSDIHLTLPPREVPLRALLGKRLAGWMNLALLGRYRELEEAPRVVRAFLADLETLSPDHVLFTGDLTGLALEAEFALARELLEPLIASGAVTGIPGNHDLYTRDAVRARLYERYFPEWLRSDESDPPPRVRYLDGHALILLQDSRPTPFHDSSGRVGPVQLARLERLIEHSRIRARARILALHYGLYRADGSPDTRLHGLRDAKAVLDAARRGGVPLILHGHLHRRFVLTAPGKDSPLLANPGSLTYKAHDRAYHVYRLEGGAVEIQVRRYDASLERFVKWPEAPGAGVHPLPPAEPRLSKPAAP